MGEIIPRHAHLTVVRVTRRIFVASMFCALSLPAQTPLPVDEIIRRSVDANQRDWNAEPSFSHVERDIDTKAGVTTDRTYAVALLDGTPYNRLVAIGGQPLSPARERQEEARERRELERRRSEGSEARERRIAKYRMDRARNNLLMTQMAVAFRFHLLGEESVEGHAAYVLRAEPDPDYRPVNRDAKVLLGMRGKLWVEEQQFHWAKVEAEVIQTVTFGGFIARVGPGTKFLVEQEPVGDHNGDSIWEPRLFSDQVRASILFWSHNSSTMDTYRDYRQ